MWGLCWRVPACALESIAFTAVAQLYSYVLTVSTVLFLVQQLLYGLGDPDDIVCH